jgi:AhpC/TSA family
MTTILSEEGVIDVQASTGLWMTASDAARATGWTLKPEGMCRDDRCVPLPASAVRGNTVDVEAFWQKLGAPVVHDDSKQAWVLGASAEARNAALGGSTAPDFTLPDLDGKLHSLSSLRGKKVFLATWASW